MAEDGEGDEKEDENTDLEDQNREIVDEMSIDEWRIW